MSGKIGEMINHDSSVQRGLHQRSFCCLNIMQIKPIFIYHQAPNDTLFVCLFVSFALVLLMLKQPQEVLIFFLLPEKLSLNKCFSFM